MKGGCHCKRIRFTVTGDPSWVGDCYCIDCRKISGSPYTIFAGYDKENIVVQGKPKVYSSSEKVQRSFCEVCSSPFAYIYKDSPEKLYIPVGIFDDPSHFEVQEHIWVHTKLPWVVIHDGLPQQE